jgi:hypothetical protein
MIGLLFAAALVDTVTVVEQNPDLVVMHEWGVVTLAGEMAVGAIPRAGYLEPWEDPGSMEDKAPVVLFYGADFSDADFTVELHGGSFTDAFPLPSGASLGDAAITWSIASGRNLGASYVIPEENLPAGGYDCGWAFESWRDGPAHVLEFPDGTRDRFIYYECSVPFEPGQPPFPFDAARGVDASFDGSVLVFDRDEGETVRMAVCSATIAADATLDWVPCERETVMEVLCGMAGGDMKSGEIADLWDTWEGYVTGGGWTGDRLMVFRLPPDLVDRLSTVSLETSEGCETQTIRFYLGMAPFSYTF